MQNQSKVNVFSAAAITVLLILLVCVRLFEEKLFYDPLLEFFRHEGKILPDYNTPRLLLHLGLRYWLNSLLSIAIVWFCFKDKSVIKVTLLLYALFFVVLMAAFFITLNADNPGLMVLFYIRRFLIQPLFLILFVPAFYYQKYVNK